MGYTYTIDAQAMFEDRTSQFESFGVPAAEILEVRAATDDMWRDGPGGWTHEWSKVAARHAAAGEHHLASLVYGCAKFPCLAGQVNRATALSMQVKEHVAASPTFPVRFERRILELPYRDGVAAVPVHLYSSKDDLSKTPVLITSGGVDTWKMDIHPMALAFAKLGLTVLAFDQPGTGESTATLSKEADEVILGLVREAKAIGNGWVAHFGLSFGANFAAMTGLSGAVHAAVVLGGPTDRSFVEEHLGKLPYGMFDILGNAMGFDRRPGLSELTSVARGLSRHDLLQQKENAPMLVINGADDYFVPQDDTTVFTDRRDTMVRLLPGTGHCAVSKMPEVMAMTTDWLREQLSRNSR
jgi:esterase FrsA